MSLTLRPYQRAAVDAIYDYFAHDSGHPVVVMPTGCHAAGARILMFDGSNRPVEEVRIGDLLMGPDSRPRRVLQLRRGREMMYRIVPKKGEPFVVNESHVLSLQTTNEGKPHACTKTGREIDNITRANDQMITTLKMSYDSIINGLKSDITRVERDLSKSDTELVTLRAIKNKTVIETASEFAAMKEAIETISGGGKDDDDDRKWYEKILGQALDSPESVGQVFSMITGQNPTAQAQQQPPQQQQLAAAQQQQSEMTLEDIPLGQPFRAEDGQIYVRVPPDGSVVPYAQAMAMAEAAEAKQNGGLKKPDAGDVKMAINFMESAFTAGTSSTDFALSARSMIPSDIIKYMETVGVDTFLNEVAVLEPGSPLRNQAGRTYMREVAKFLLEGVTG